MHGCRGGVVAGGHALLLEGGCVVVVGLCVVVGGHAWLLGGVHGCQGV